MHVAVNVLDHHNGIIDQNADGKNQRKQRDAVQGKAPGPAGKQGNGQRDNDGRTNDHGFAPAHGSQHQNHHSGSGKQQLGNQLIGFLFGGDAIIAGHNRVNIGRQQAVFQ